ncbi:hypothetical protein CSAL01_08933 [Colletotrichum salicis]|uniref:Integral membrane protein n=1 Tax=Colletotrichum salicis TaxID=1209931 RepID=A0A135U157_9PEZI|nr:hypothetical protein CSAL01_08933 [Colletotrichum salicis]
MNYMDVQLIVGLVFTVVLGLAVIAGLVFFVSLLRKTSRGYHDPICRWVAITKAAMGLWLFAELIYVIVSIISFANGSSYDYYSSLAKFISYTTSILSWMLDVSQALTFLALFYLAQAITLLRTDETSKRYRIGKKFSIGAVILISLLSFTGMCLWISTRNAYYSSWVYESSEYQGVMMRRLVAQIFDLVVGIFNLLCAIGAVTYVALVRKNALKGPLHKASNLALAISIVWLLRGVWSLFMSLYSRYGYVFYDSDTNIWFNVISIIIGILGAFAVYVMLYLLATKDKYGLNTRGKLAQPTKLEDEEALGAHVTTANRRSSVV